MMASTKADGNREAWVYTDDAGNDYTIASKTVYTSDGTDGGKYGGSQADGTKPPIPKGLLPRRVKCVDSTGFAKWPIAYETTATLWSTPGTELTLDKNGVDTVFASTARRRNERDTRRLITQTS